MNPRTRRELVDGPAGVIECAWDEPEGTSDSGPKGIALLCHPHPLHGGTLDNKVVQTLARAFVQRGWRAVRLNFRGVGSSVGHWDDGVGEIEDAWAVLNAFDQPGQRWAIGGFSFGSYVASHLVQRMVALQRTPAHVVLVGPAVVNFTMAEVPPYSLVVHGQDDEVVPLPAVFRWAQSASLPVTVVPGTGHFFHGQLALLKNIVLNHCPA